jgi:hypothetical protein
VSHNGSFVITDISHELAHHPEPQIMQEENRKVAEEE